MALVRFYAAARDAAGVGDASIPATSTVVLVETLTKKYGEPMERILRIASLLVDGQQVGANVDRELSDDATVDILPPFAGG
jgi:molybdopterin synthase sulfur carrier subunit